MVREGVVRPWRLRSIALFQSRAPERRRSPRSSLFERHDAHGLGREGGPRRRARLEPEALDLLGGALDDHVADAQAHAAAFRGQAVHGAGQAVEAVRRRLQRDADLPRVDGDADPARGRLGRPHHPAGVERDLDAAVGAARQQVAAGEGGHEGVGGVRDELGRGALLAQAPVDDDPDAVGQRGGVAEVVGDEQRRAAPGRRARPAARRARPRACARRAPTSGSSRSSTCGSRASARATATRWRSPPDSPPGRSSARWAMRKRSSSSRTRASLAPPKATLARTVMCGKSAYSWKTRPTERRSGGRSTLRCGVEPRRARRARSARGRGAAGPAMARRTVVLPAPEGPTSATVSAPTVRLTPSSNERRATAMSSSSVATRRASCTRAARRR